MADMIIIAALAAAVFFILRGRLRRLRSGQCGGGCAGCAGGGSGCMGCGGSCGSRGGCAGGGAACAPEEGAE